MNLIPLKSRILSEKEVIWVFIIMEFAFQTSWGQVTKLSDNPLFFSWSNFLLDALKELFSSEALRPVLPNPPEHQGVFLRKIVFRRDRFQAILRVF